MGLEKNTISSFTDLNAWKQGHGFVMGVYNATRKFPDDEKFGLANQMRRSAVSITSNIAEGFSRRTKADKQNFYIMAKGSLTELQNQLIIARDAGYIEGKAFSKLSSQSVDVSKLITGLIRSAEDKK